MKLRYLAILVVTFIASQAAAQTVLNDAMGYMWDVQINGSISDGSTDTFDGAYTLYVNGNNFNGSGMTNEKGIITLGPTNVGGVSVTRDIMLTTDPAGIVFVDSYKNAGGAATDVTPMHYSDMGETATPQNAQSKKGGLKASLYQQQNGRSSVTMIFGDDSTSYLPTMSVSGDELTISYPSFKLAAGQSRSIGYFVGQRPTGSGPELRDDKRAFSKSLGEIASKKNFNFLNVPGMNLFNLGNIELVGQGEMDFLETRQGDKVYGSLSTQEFVLDTALGQRKLNVGDDH